MCRRSGDHIVRRRDQSKGGGLTSPPARITPSRKVRGLGGTLADETPLASIVATPPAADKSERGPLRRRGELRGVRLCVRRVKLFNLQQMKMTPL
jgi:hypothetical protein